LNGILTVTDVSTRCNFYVDIYDILHMPMPGSDQDLPVVVDQNRACHVSLKWESSLPCSNKDYVAAFSFRNLLFRAGSLCLQLWVMRNSTTFHYLWQDICNINLFRWYHLYYCLLNTIIISKKMEGCLQWKPSLIVKAHLLSCQETVAC